MIKYKKGQAIPGAGDGNAEYTEWSEQKMRLFDGSLSSLSETRKWLLDNLIESLKEYRLEILNGLLMKRKKWKETYSRWVKRCIFANNRLIRYIEQCINILWQTAKNRSSLSFRDQDMIRGDPFITMIMNEKGGVGKSVTAIQLAAGYSLNGMKTLIIDGDPQGSITNLLLDEKTVQEVDQKGLTISTVLEHPDKINECIYPVPSLKNTFIIPSTGLLTHTMKQLEFNSLTSYPNKLQKAFRHLKGFDQVVIDNNPSFSWIVYNACAVTDLTIVPTNIEFNSLRGIDNTIEDMTSVLSQLDNAPEMEIKILVTRKGRTNDDLQRLAEINAKYGEHSYKTVIPNQDKPVRDSLNDHKILLMSHDKKKKAARSYRQLVDEILVKANDFLDRIKELESDRDAADQFSIGRTEEHSRTKQHVYVLKE